MLLGRLSEILISSSLTRIGGSGLAAFLAADIATYPPE